MQVNPPPPPPGPPRTPLPGMPGMPPAGAAPAWSAGPAWSPTVPAPQPPRPRRRRGWIVIGVLVVVLGLLVTIGGGVALLVSRTASSLDPIAEARTPGTATFVAEAETYDVLLVTGRHSSARTSADLDCEVTLSDGRVITLEGSAQMVSTEVANTESIGSFDAVPGPTSVFCEADGGDNRFVVDVEGMLARVALWVLFGGVFLLLAGGGLVLLGALWKRPATQSG